MQCLSCGCGLQPGEDSRAGGLSLFAKFIALVAFELLVFSRRAQVRIDIQVCCTHGPRNCEMPPRHWITRPQNGGRRRS
jgi:hypothetical protein